MTSPLALTMGEPGGVGPEIALKAYAALRSSAHRFFCIGDPRLFPAAEIAVIGAPAEADRAFARALPVFDVGVDAPATAGIADPASAAAVIAAIEQGVAFALSGKAAGVVTNPVQKASLASAGFGWPGHTEFIEHLTRDAPMPTGRQRGAVMMIAGPSLRTVPVTIHQSVREAAASLSIGMIVGKAVIVMEALAAEFGVARPRIAISGLNPHAGEKATIGQEERDIIEPAVAALRARFGDAVTGPHPADTLFHDEARQRYDAALCMLHDQALIPAKTLAFHDAVNVTLGLPIIRTSPDHGTALDIAGKGLARADSLIAAIRLASALAAARARMNDALPPLRDVIARHDLGAKKALGQHFLLDLNITRKIARAATAGPDDTILEIGPGPGGLTRALLETGARVIAIERDRRFVAALEELREAYPSTLTIVEADALRADERALAAPAPIKIVANLPYNISTELLVKWLIANHAVSAPLWSRMTLMFQKEVADRILARPGSKTYGRLSVIAQAASRPSRAFDLPARAFTPPPKVESSVVIFDPAPARLSDLAALERLTQAAFSQRRKMLRSSLKPLFSADVEARLAAASIDATKRAEEIDVLSFLRLADC